MGKLTFNIAVSVDGFAAGPNMSRDEPLGEGGERLHEWMLETRAFKESHGGSGGAGGPDSDVVDEFMSAPSAYIMGRRMFGGEGPWDNPDWGDEPWEGWWGDEPPFHRPVFVLTSHERDPLVKGDTTFTFVTDGIESALEQARDAAGDGEITIGGGASTIQQYLSAGLVDEFQLHLAPVLLGGGRRLFEEGGGPGSLELLRTVASPGVTHLKYRVVK